MKDIQTACSKAESKLKRPPYPLEIFVQLNSKPKEIYEYLALLNAVYREDLLLTNFKAYSTTKQDGFYSFSELFRQ